MTPVYGQRMLFVASPSNYFRTKVLKFPILTQRNTGKLAAFISLLVAAYSLVRFRIFSVGFEFLEELVLKS